MITNYQNLNRFFEKELLNSLKLKSVGSKAEICGFIVNGNFFEKRNHHPDKENFFLISPKDCLWGDSVVLFHSHPKHIKEKNFSSWDLTNQYYFNLDMLLYSVNNDEFYFNKS